MEVLPRLPMKLHCALSKLPLCLQQRMYRVAQHGDCTFCQVLRRHQLSRGIQADAADAHAFSPKQASLIFLVIAAAGWSLQTFAKGSLCHRQNVQDMAALRRELPDSSVGVGRVVCHVNAGCSQMHYRVFHNKAAAVQH